MSRIKIELEKVLKERKISKNQLCYACKLQHTQLNNYCKNKVVRVDLATIAKICDYVGCSIADIRDSGRVKETCRIKNNLYNLKGSFRRGKSLKDPFIQP